MRTITIGGEEFRIQGAVIACNGEGNALSPGALAGDASADNQTAVQANAGSNSAKVIGIQGVSGGKSVPVTAAATDAKLDTTNAALAATQADAGADSTKVVGVQGVAGGKDVPVVAAATDTKIDDTNTKLDELKALIGTAADAAGVATVIGLLKQIAVNTTPP